MVQSTRVGGGSFQVGAISKIRTGGDCYEGVVIASGKYEFFAHLHL